MLKLPHNCTHPMLWASKVMLKILQARLQKYVNQELPDVQAGFRKGRGTRFEIANIVLLHRCVFVEVSFIQPSVLCVLGWACSSIHLWKYMSFYYRLLSVYFSFILPIRYFITLKLCIGKLYCLWISFQDSERGIRSDKFENSSRLSVFLSLTMENLGALLQFQKCCLSCSQWK